MSKTYEDGYADGYDAGRDDPSDDIIAEIAALQARIDALEWLREVEEALESIQDWHPQWHRYIYNPAADARYDDALVELAYTVENAREAVES